MDKLIYSKSHKFLAQQLQHARIESGFNQAQVAKMFGKTQSYVSKIESGQRKIDVVQLKKFAKIYKKDFNFFIE